MRVRNTAVTAGALGLAVACGIPHHAGAADPARYLPPPGAPYQAQEVRVRPSGGLYSLGGTLTVPRDGRRRHPAVVLISGAGKQDRNNTTGESDYRPFYELADTLSRHGISVLRLDDRGVGSSTGSLDSTTTYDRSLDTRAALAFLRSRPDVDRERLGLIGFSEGGLIAPMIAAEDSALAGIVLLAPPSASGRDVVRWQHRRAAEGRTDLSPAQRDSLYAAMTAEWERKAEVDAWTRYIALYDPLLVAERVRVPVLVLQGTADEAVPPEGVARLVEAFQRGGNRDVTSKSFEGLTHVFLRESDFVPGATPVPAASRISRPVLGAIVEWSLRHFEPRPDPPAKKPVKKPVRKRVRRR